MTKQCTNVPGGCQEKGMRLLTSQRENLQAVSQEQSNTGNGRLAYDNGALEIEACPYGSGSPTRIAEVGEITHLACLMEI